MTVPFNVGTTPKCEDRSQLLALRMLQGSALASIHAYRLRETLDPVVHGVTADGLLAIVAVPTGLTSVQGAGWEIDVRLDLVKKSLDPRVSILVASGHALGSMTWASPTESDRYVAEGQLPMLLQQALEVPGARLAFIDVERLVLHDMSGAVVVPYDEMALGTPTPGEEFAGTGLLSGYNTSELKDLCWSVMVGRIPGTVTRKSHGGVPCSHTINQVFCVDVDALGVTVMLVAAHELVIVHARFAQAPDSLTELEALIASLMKDSAPERTRRI